MFECGLVGRPVEGAFAMLRSIDGHDDGACFNLVRHGFIVVRD